MKRTLGIVLLLASCQRPELAPLPLTGQERLVLGCYTLSLVPLHAGTDRRAAETRQLGFRLDSLAIAAYLDGPAERIEESVQRWLEVRGERRGVAQAHQRIWHLVSPDSVSLALVNGREGQGWYLTLALAGDEVRGMATASAGLGAGAGQLYNVIGRRAGCGVYADH